MSNEYQLRVDGKPVRFYTIIGQSEMDEWAEFAQKNPGVKVEIVQVFTNVIMNQYNYHLFKGHFEKERLPEVPTFDQEKG